MWEHDRFPAWFTIMSLTLVVTVTVVRLLLVRSTTAERLINKIVLLGTLTALLREPAIAAQVAPFVPGGAPMLFDLWHALFLVTCGYFVGLFLLWDLGVERYRQPMVRTVAVSCVTGILLIALGEPARDAGVSVPDAGGWRYGAYFVAYAGLLVIFCLWQLRPVVTLRKRTSSRRETCVVVILFLMVANGAVIMSMMAVGNVMGAAGIDNAYTDLAYLGASGEPLLLWVVLGCAALVPSALQAVTQALRIDADSRELRRLYPVWRDLTAATPMVVFTLHRSDRRGSTPAEKLHRRRVEILDAAAIIGRYIEPLPDAIEELVEVSDASGEDREDLRDVLALAVAAWRISSLGGTERAGGPTQPQYTVPDVETLAQLWNSAQSLVEQVGSLGMLCPGQPGSR